MTRKRSSPLGLELLVSLALASLAVLPLLTEAAPLQEYTEIQQYSEGCYYNYAHYNEGDRIMTNEPCLNCTCHNRMLMCYLRVCPFTKPIGHDCIVEKREDQCCPIITCPEVPVDVPYHTPEPGTELSIPEKFGCSIEERFYPEGAQVPSNPNKPCELCYCINNQTKCVMQECTLHVDGCTPIYNKGSCCPVRYSCDHENDVLELEDQSTTTTTVRPTPGFILTTTMTPSVSTDCVHDGETYADGASILGKNACEHCYCMRGDIVCAVQECEMPMMAASGKSCRAMPAAEGECCPSNYVCEDDSATTEIVEGITQEAGKEEDETTTVTPVKDIPGEIPKEDLDLQEHIDDEEQVKEQDKEKATESPVDEKEQDKEKATESPVDEKEQDKERATESPVDEKEQDKEKSTESPVDEKEQDKEKATESPVDEKEQDKEKATESPVDEIGSGEVDTTAKPDLGGDAKLGTTDEEEPEPSTEGSTETPSTAVEDSGEKDILKPATSTEEESTDESIAKTTTPKSIDEKTTSDEGESEEEDIAKTTAPSSIDRTTESIKPTASSEEVTSVEDSEKPTTPKTIDEHAEAVKPTPTPEEGSGEEDISKPTTSAEEGSGEEDFGKITTPKTVDEEIEPAKPTAPADESISEKDVPRATTPLPVEGEDITTDLSAEQDEDHDEKMGTTTPESVIAHDVPASESPKQKPTESSTSVPTSAEDKEETATSLPTSEDKDIDKKEKEKPDEIETPPKFLPEDDSSYSTTQASSTEKTEGETADEETSTAAAEKEIVPSTSTPLETQKEPSKEADDSETPTQQTPAKSDITPADGEVDQSTAQPDDKAELPTSKPDTAYLPPSSGHIDGEEKIDVSPAPEGGITEPSQTTTEKEQSTVSSIDNRNDFVTDADKEATTVLPTSDETSPEEIPDMQLPAVIPGEGDCLVDGKTYPNNTIIPATALCDESCKCISSIVACKQLECNIPQNRENCIMVPANADSCCPTYICDTDSSKDDETTTVKPQYTEKPIERDDEVGVDTTTTEVVPKDVIMPSGITEQPLSHIKPDEDISQTTTVIPQSTETTAPKDTVKPTEEKTSEEDGIIEHETSKPEIGEEAQKPVQQSTEPTDSKKQPEDEIPSPTVVSPTEEAKPSPAEDSSVPQAEDKLPTTTILPTSEGEEGKPADKIPAPEDKLETDLEDKVSATTVVPPLKDASTESSEEDATTTGDLSDEVEQTSQDQLSTSTIHTPVDRVTEPAVTSISTSSEVETDESGKFTTQAPSAEDGLTKPADEKTPSTSGEADESTEAILESTVRPDEGVKKFLEKEPLSPITTTPASDEIEKEEDSEIKKSSDEEISSTEQQPTDEHTVAPSSEEKDREPFKKPSDEEISSTEEQPTDEHTVAPSSEEEGGEPSDEVSPTAAPPASTTKVEDKPEVTTVIPSLQEAHKEPTTSSEDEVKPTPEDRFDETTIVAPARDEEPTEQEFAATVSPSKDESAFDKFDSATELPSEEEQKEPSDDKVLPSSIPSEDESKQESTTPAATSAEEGSTASSDERVPSGVDADKKPETEEEEVASTSLPPSSQDSKKIPQPEDTLAGTESPVSVPGAQDDDTEVTTEQKFIETTVSPVSDKEEGATPEEESKKPTDDSVATTVAPTSSDDEGKEGAPISSTSAPPSDLDTTAPPAAHVPAPEEIETKPMDEVLSQTGDKKTSLIDSMPDTTVVPFTEEPSHEKESSTTAAEEEPSKIDAEHTPLPATTLGKDEEKSDEQSTSTSLPATTLGKDEDKSDEQSTSTPLPSVDEQKEASTSVPISAEEKPKPAPEDKFETDLEDKVSATTVVPPLKDASTESSEEGATTTGDLSDEVEQTSQDQLSTSTIHIPVDKVTEPAVTSISTSSEVETDESGKFTTQAPSAEDGLTKPADEKTPSTSGEADESTEAILESTVRPDEGVKKFLEKEPLSPITTTPASDEIEKEEDSEIKKPSDEEISSTEQQPTDEHTVAPSSEEKGGEPFKKPSDEEISSTEEQPTDEHTVAPSSEEEGGEPSDEVSPTAAPPASTTKVEDKPEVTTVIPSLQEVHKEPTTSSEDEVKPTPEDRFDETTIVAPARDEEPTEQELAATVSPSKDESAFDKFDSATELPSEEEQKEPSDDKVLPSSIPSEDESKQESTTPAATSAEEGSTASSDERVPSGVDADKKPETEEEEVASTSLPPSSQDSKKIPQPEDTLAGTESPVSVPGAQDDDTEVTTEQKFIETTVSPVSDKEEGATPEEESKKPTDDSVATTVAPTSSDDEGKEGAPISSTSAPPSDLDTTAPPAAHVPAPEEIDTKPMDDVLSQTEDEKISVDDIASTTISDADVDKTPVTVSPIAVDIQTTTDDKKQPASEEGVSDESTEPIAHAESPTKPDSEAELHETLTESPVTEDVLIAHTVGPMLEEGADKSTEKPESDVPTIKPVQEEKTTAAPAIAPSLDSTEEGDESVESEEEQTAGDGQKAGATDSSTESEEVSTESADKKPVPEDEEEEVPAIVSEIPQQHTTAAPSAQNETSTAADITESDESSTEQDLARITTMHPLFAQHFPSSTKGPIIDDRVGIDESTDAATTQSAIQTSAESSTSTSTTETPLTTTPASSSHYEPVTPPAYGQPPQYPSYPEDEYDEEEVFGPGTCRYAGKLYVSAQQIPRDDPCDFCFCFRSDIICLQQSCPPPIAGCHEEPISGFCCPRYECPVSMAAVLNITTSTTTTSTTLPPHFLAHNYGDAVERNGCLINGRSYKVGEPIESTSGPCISCTCGGDGKMKCDPQQCVPEPTMQQVMAAVASGRKR
ncbi:mucin-5AC [Scaptodrosophila lebanonensis]|uniref:Mucin-5AC n=1 Tax=Drosophila lebanonensis TaxID=7225 RepID=A0A6J2SZA9_DROLE|nr:mucin-5AC [Scaptodrosophila lebanonensis]